ncbi:calcium-binding protein [Rhizobium leguminosarum]|uniref:calcium-binding protein n=1 Tax=Rhizobium leguminosarum TaxID=384 RepID=UPI001C943D05|nr:hypothetical protein [Rhizobium leguminosarum]MBY5766623.1 calcium-binding protein [Rhizobium leguminosarum]
MSSNFVAANGQVALTDLELDAMDSMLSAHDRAGFYMVYHMITGSEEAALQASISSFSDIVGGVALAANRILQTWIGPGTQADNYTGIYTQSQLVAESALAAINSLRTDTGGFITDQQFFESAVQAWSDVGLQDYFPGNLLSDQGDIGLFALDLFNKLDMSVANPIGSFIAEMRNDYNPGVLASLLGLIAGDLFGKQESDFTGGTDAVVTAGGYTLHVDASGHTNAVLGLDGDDTLAGAGRGLLIAAIAENDPQALPAFREYLKELIWPSSEGAIDRSHLSEFYSSGFNGDMQPPTAVTQPVPEHPAWHQTATADGDILALETTGVLDGDAGNDILFGSEYGLIDSGADFLSGGDGDDILVGLSGGDTLLGDAGNDVLRGGGGVDILVGGNGQDVLDGGENEDILVGGNGQDELVAGAGALDLTEPHSDWNDDARDTLYGGEGHDTYLVYSNFRTGESSSPEDLADIRDNKIDFIDAQDSDFTAHFQFLDSVDEINVFTLTDELIQQALQNYDGSGYRFGSMTFTGDFGVWQSDVFGTEFGNDLILTVSTYFTVNSYLGGLLNFASLERPAMIGTEDDDYLNGSAGDDTLYGAGGSDLFYGGHGDDFIDGDSGGPGGSRLSEMSGADIAANEDAIIDEVEYDGQRSDYVFTANQDGSVTVVNLLDGTDTLLNIESIYFYDEDESYDLSELVSAPDNPPEGTSGNDTLLSTSGDDVTSSLAGNEDTVSGYGGDGPTADIIEFPASTIEVNVSDHELSISENSQGEGSGETEGTLSAEIISLSDFLHATEDAGAAGDLWYEPEPIGAVI